jgi:hypothetical protein
MPLLALTFTIPSSLPSVPEETLKRYVDEACHQRQLIPLAIRSWREIPFSQDYYVEVVVQPAAPGPAEGSR